MSGMHSTAKFDIRLLQLAWPQIVGNTLKYTNSKYERNAELKLLSSFCRYETLRIVFYLQAAHGSRKWYGALEMTWISRERRFFSISGLHYWSK
jgi:hypothetical protein